MHPAGSVAEPDDLALDLDDLVLVPDDPALEDVVFVLVPDLDFDDAAEGDDAVEGDGAADVGSGSSSMLSSKSPFIPSSRAPRR
jgi:hypothetical protein